MQFADLDYFRHLARRLAQAAHGSKRQIVRQAAETMGLSVNQVYRRLQAVGWSSGRKLREDAGDTRLDADAAEYLASLMSRSTRMNGKRLMPATVALEIASANGKLATPIGPNTALRILRLRGLHPEQLAHPTPHTPLASLHPNHVWQFDVSVCVLYYLDARKGLEVMDERRFYKNKPQNLKKIFRERVLRYLVTDHRSGAFYVHYYLAAGEDQETLFDFLMRAMGRREHRGDLMHGVPFRLVWDAGSANQSYLIKNLLDQLQVMHWAHVPGNPRAKGSVESHHNIVETHFESRLRYEPVTTIDELNDKAHTWMRAFNATAILKRTGTTRYAVWQTIRREELRIRPPRELCQQLLSGKPETRRVRGDLSIGFRVKGFEALEYSVAHIPTVRVGETVQVAVNPYSAPNVNVIVVDRDGRETRFECPPIKKDAAGFRLDAPVIGEAYRAAPDTDVDRNRKELLKKAYGAATLEDAEAAAKRGETPLKGVDAISYLEHQVAAHFLERRGAELPIERPRTEAAPLSHVAAAKVLVRRLGRDLEPAEFRLLAELHPDGVPETAIGDLMSRLTTHGSRFTNMG